MLRRMLSRTFGVTLRSFRAAVRLPFVAVRRHWKAGLLAVLVLNLLFTVSGFLERRFTPPPLIAMPSDTDVSWMKHHRRLQWAQNPYFHYTSALSLAHSADLNLILDYRDQQKHPLNPSPPSNLPPPPGIQSYTSQEPEPHITEAQLEQAIKRLQPAIREFHRGAECSAEKLVFPLEDSHVTSSITVPVTLFYSLTSVFGYVGMRAIENGDPDYGLQVLLDLLEMATDLTRSTWLVDAWGIRDRAFSRVGQALHSGCLEASHCRRIVRELQRIEAEGPDYEWKLRDQYCVDRSLLLDFLDTSYYDADYRKMVGDDGYWELTSPWMYIYKSVPGMRTWVMRNHSRAWKRILDTQTQPFPTAMAVWHEVLHKPEPWLCDHYLKDRLTPRLDFVNKVFASGTGFRSSLVAATTYDLRARGLMLVAALEAHCLERGRYPESLDALVGDYLPSVPTDPFTDGKAFKYSLKDGEYLLYSVGPDMKDDGGKANPFYIVEDDYVGDLILGPGADLWKND